MNHQKATVSVFAELLTANKEHQINYTVIITLIKLLLPELSEFIIGTYKNQLILLSQTNLLIKKLCSIFLYWRIK
jgi:hypothetical protein